jgi:hypothetical protein
VNKRDRLAAYARADVAVAETALAHWRETGHDTHVWFGLDETGTIIEYADNEPGPGWGCRTCDPDLFEQVSA